MKKSSKITLLIGLLIFVLGIGATAIGMTALGWDFYKLDTNNYTEKYIDVTDAIFTDKMDEDGNITISKIETNVDDWSIKVMAGEEFSFKYYITEHVVTEEITFNDGVIKIKIKEDWTQYFNVDIFGDSMRWKLRYEMTIPQNIDLELDFQNSEVVIDNANFGNFKIKCNNGKQVYTNTNFSSFESYSNNSKLEMTDCSSDKVILSSNNDKSTFNNCELNTISYNSNNSKLQFKGSLIKALSIKSNNATVLINTTTVRDGTNISGNNTKVTVEDSAFGTFDINSNNDRVTLKRVEMTSLNIISDNSRVITEVYLDCETINIDSKNARVSLILVGSKDDIKHIKFSCKNSTVRLNSNKLNADYHGNGTKTITAKCNNANLDISFYSKTV